MKKFLSVILALVLCLSLASCGSKRASAESVVESGIKAFQNADEEAIQQYWGDADFTDVPTEETTAEDDAYGQELLEKLASNLTYRITGSSEDEDAGTATVTVEFTNIDMGAIVPEWIGDVFTKALGYAFLPEDQQPSEEELSAMYMDSLNSAIDNHAGDVVTNTVDVTLSLVDDEWKINATDDVIDAMVGGMMSSFSSLGDSFGGLEESSEPTETVRTNPANLGDYTVEIKSATVTQDYDGNPAVIITYSWTNNSSETTSPMLSISTAVFQDGIGMDSAFIYDDPAYDGDMYTTDVRPGTTVDVQEAFELSNTTSPIEVEITEAFSWDEPTEIAYLELDIA